MANIYSIFKTFFIYSTAPFRIIFIFILIMISNFFILNNMKNEGDIMATILWCSKTFIFLMSYKINISKEDFIKYMKYLYSCKKYLCVFNHTTLLDGNMLLSIFPRSSLVINRQKEHDYLGYTQKINDLIGSIIIDNGGNTSNRIKDRIDNRKIGDPVLFIAPCMGKTPDIPGNITDFKKNGAFINKYPILPIIIKYEDDSLNYNQDFGESFIHSYLKLFIVENYNINIVVGDMVEPYEKETVDEFKYRVYNIMNDQYKEM